MKGSESEPKLPGMPGPSAQSLEKLRKLENAIEKLHAAISDFEFPPDSAVKLTKTIKGDKLSIVYTPGE